MNKRECVALEAAARVYCARTGTDPEEAINFPHPVKRWELAVPIVKPIIAAYEAALAEEEPSEAEVEAAYRAFRVETGDLTEALAAALRAARKARMG